MVCFPVGGSSSLLLPRRNRDVEFVGGDSDNNAPLAAIIIVVVAVVAEVMSKVGMRSSHHGRRAIHLQNRARTTSSL